MSFLLRAAIGVTLTTAIAACSAPAADEAAVASESNLGEGDVLPTGPLKPDLSFANGGTLALEGTSSALALARRADGVIAVMRERTLADGSELVVSLVKPDGSATSDVVLPGVTHLDRARVLPQGDGLVIIGGGTRYYAARIGGDGALDPTFMPDPLDVSPADAAVDAGGRILIAGSLAGSKAVLVRLTANGAVDTTFAGGQGAWIETKDGASSASFVALGVKDTIAVAAMHEDGPAVLRLDADGKTDAGFGEGGRVALPKNGTSTFGLVAASDGAFTYYGPSADSPAAHAFEIAKDGTVTPGAKVEGTLLDARSQLSAVTTGEACMLHVATATAELTAAQCAAGVPYVALGGGKRAIAITTPGAGVSLRVFAQ